MGERTYRRGDIVRLLAYGGDRLVRRVWQDLGRGVAICSEDTYQRAIRDGIAEPNCVGWPREDVLELISQDEA